MTAVAYTHINNQSSNVTEASNLKGSILVVEDDNDLREALTDTLQMANFEVTAVNSAEAAISFLRNHSADMIVSDVNMGAMSGHDLLRHVQQQHAQIPMLLVTAYASVSDSVDAMRLGAVDYLVKPFKPETLVQTVERYIGCGVTDDDEPVAESASSKQLLQIARRVAVSDSTVLIQGESGTGKEVLARYIHQNSPRKKQPFIAINCAAIPENMLEAMLFGHEKGAFTGAYSSAPGKFEQANGGTLLLDEISEMPMALQAKLLRVLQEREVERLGGRKIIELDVRVLATTNREMRKEVQAGRFREDLFYRLNVLPIGWSPLRERRDDILPLAEKLLRSHAAKQHRQGMLFSAATRQALYNHDWFGNVRELDNVVQRALVLQTGREIEPDNLMLELSDGGPISQNDMLAQLTSPSSAQVVPLQPVEAPVVPIAAPQGEESFSSGLGGDLRQRELEIIVNTLKEVRGSRKLTAERLGISPRTLRYKMAKLRDEGFDVDEAMAKGI